MKIINFNTKILKQLRETSPEKWEQAISKFPKLEKWLYNEDKPTFRQLKELAKLFNIPFGYFFLENLPQKQLPIPHYRTVKQQVQIIPSDNLLDTIKFAQKLQLYAKDILLQWGNEPLPFAGKFNINTPLEKITTELRKILNIKINWAEDIPSWNDALQVLIKRSEQAGIFVLLNGIVGNNTHRKLDVNEFRGFVLYDEIAPVIFINNNDALSAKIFTLIHEIVHILIGKSGVFDFSLFYDKEVLQEIFCDKATAEFLVPTEVLLSSDNFDDLQALAKRFKVSQIVIARRLLDIGVWKKEDFFNFYENYAKKEAKNLAHSGGNFYNTQPYRLSRRFLSIVNTSISQGQLLFREAYHLLGLNPKTFQNLINRNFYD